MDITLLRTFFEVANTGSFVAASERLFVTQSAVSLRVQRLEDDLGRPLFVRSKAGAELTPAGRAFERYAIGILRTWEEARQQVAIPEGFHRSLSVAAQYSLWPRLGFRWVDGMRAAMPDLSIRTDVGMPERLTRFLIEGVAQAALMFTPQLRPGLTAEAVTEDELVLVAGWEGPTLESLEGRYIFCDWGPEFVQAHALTLPHLTNPGLTFSLGTLTAQYVMSRGMAAYLPARFIKTHLDAGQLHIVPDAPRFAYPVWVVWRDDLDAEVAAMARKALSEAALSIDEDQSDVMAQMARMGGTTGALMEDLVPHIDE
ncbi:LysR family transcriptional regulator [Alphaproteobacteria bacterium KMM 3653]|uniref:LysR family transcriptional regulator n=1 Tax=Harenicola maris TaxID=2841044 RepID=A0AAP2CRS7_9RHOB|nr:LysR family transcriptional regulator [Harenicola maris]